MGSRGGWRGGGTFLALLLAPVQGRLFVLVSVNSPPSVMGGLNCDFESSGLCSWQNTGAEDWEVVQGREGDPGDTGPAHDHTTQNTSGHIVSGSS